MFCFHLITNTHHSNLHLIFLLSQCHPEGGFESCCLVTPPRPLTNLLPTYDPVLPCGALAEFVQCLRLAIAERRSWRDYFKMQI